MVSLEPMNPNDPASVVAETSDSESGVAGGSIEMAPAGTSSWTALPATFTGNQLVAHFNDAGMHGPYTFSVRSCDSVGNCSSTARTVMLPLRTQAVSEVSLEQLPTTRCRRPASSTMRLHRRQRSHHKQVSETRPPADFALRLARRRIRSASRARLTRSCPPPEGFRQPAPPGASGCRWLTATASGDRAGQPWRSTRSHTRAAVRPRRGSRPERGWPLAGR